MRTNILQARKALLALFAMLMPLVTNAHDFQAGGIYYNITSEARKTVEVTFRGDYYYSYDDEYSGSITIPSAINRNGVAYSVTSIGDIAFFGCKYLTSITLPESVTSIGNNAFQDCSSLNSITIPENSQLKSIDYSAFSGCSSLTSINIPESVTTSIGNRAFYNCSSLTSINIPDGVTSIENEAFSGCSSLNSITIPENSQLTSIGFQAFYGCSSLKSITIPEDSKLTSIGKDAFYDCRSLTAITIPEYVKSIGDYAFEGCRRLERVTINCANVGSWFSGLSSLKEIVLGESVTSIGESAFSSCWSLTSITLPASVTSIGDQAFRGCSSLTAITIPEDSKLTSIGDEAFQFCDNLTAITLPKSLTSIGDYAFLNCGSLTAITIPASVTSIAEGTFSGCESLTSITLPASVTSIGDEAFYCCWSLTAITIPASVTSIGDEAFASCRSLENITIPASVTSIGGGAFSDCSSLTAITLPASVTSIGYGAFYKCSSLTSITLPASVTSIGDQAFRGCSSLTAITLPEGVTSIGESAFEDCSSLTAITIPESVTSIGDYAICDCSSLESITIPASVTSIGEGAFAGCSSLTRIYCNAMKVPATGADVFANYNATLYVPQSAMASYQSTAPWSNFSNIRGPITLGDQIAELSDLSNDKVYTLRSARAFLLHSEAEGVADSICSNTGKSVGAVEYALGNPALHFRIEKQGGNYYLYSVGAGQYVGVNGSYEAQANTVLKIEKVGGDYPWKLYLGDHGMNSQDQGRTNRGILVDSWTITDVGNCYQIVEAATPSITFNQYIKETETLTLTATVKPDIFAHEAVTWSSSNPSVATVDATTGVVTAVAAGTVTITASLYDGRVVASCELNVTPASYVITFLIDGEQFYTQTLTRGSAITLPDVPAKKGYTFSGWGEVPETMPAGNLTITGSYSINSYTLTYVVDGEAVLTLPFLYGGSIPSLKEPTKEGYTFSGWSEFPETMPANDVTIEGTFTQLPSVFLTINQADNGYVKQHLTAGTVCTFTIEAAEGWKIHSVTFNGEEVTAQLTEEGTFTTPALSEDAVLNIAYEKNETPTTAASAQASLIKVQGHHGILRITGTTQGAAISVYTTDGMLVAQESAEGSETQLTLPTGQVYIVTVGDKVVKIGL